MDRYARLNVRGKVAHYPCGMISLERDTMVLSTSFSDVRQLFIVGFHGLVPSKDIIELIEGYVLRNAFEHFIPLPGHIRGFEIRHFQMSRGF